MTTIYAIGYAGKSLQEIRRHMESLDACLIDIRYAPHSKNAEFQKKNLQTNLGPSHYLYLQEFGNQNYKGNNHGSNDGIELVDYETGKAKLIEFVTNDQKPNNAILLCGCRNASTCHRTYVLNRLEKDGFQTQELEPG